MQFFAIPRPSTIFMTESVLILPPYCGLTTVLWAESLIQAAAPADKWGCGKEGRSRMQPQLRGLPRSLAFRAVCFYAMVSLLAK